MPPKKRGKKGKRQNQPQREQKDPEGNEQGHLQGGGASSANVGVTLPIPSNLDGG